MQKPNLIIYESQMKSIMKHCLKSKQPTTAEQMIMAMFSYYLDGEFYDGENEVVDMFMDSVYPLIDKQQENFTRKVENIISNEEFTALATSGDFATQKALAEYITERYGEYSQSAVSKRLKTLGLTLVKKSPKTNNPSVNYEQAQQIRKAYESRVNSLGEWAARQHIEDTYGVTLKEVESVLGGR